MMTEAGLLDARDETLREYERIVDAAYLEEVRDAANHFPTKRLSRQARLAECAIRNFKKGKNTIRLRSLRKLIRAIHDLQNRTIKNSSQQGASSFLRRGLNCEPGVSAQKMKFGV